MSDFITIAEAKLQKKGNILFKVISLGELKTGTAKTGSNYEKQDAVIKDSSGAMNLTLWNDDIGKLEPGMYYSLENAWWSEYKGDVQLSLGNYFELEKISETDFVNNSANPAQPTIEQSAGPARTAGTPPPSATEKYDAVMAKLDEIYEMLDILCKKAVKEELEKSAK